VPAARPVGLTETLMEPGVVPLAGVAVSHAPPVVVVLVVVKLRAAPLLLVETLCAAGAAPPACAVNVSVVGLRVRFGRPAAVTVKVTATVRGLLAAPALATETVPEYVPAARPVGLTETLMEPGVVPLAGVAVSHAPPVVVVLVVVKLRAAPLLLVETLCAAGAAPPACAVKVSVVGLRVRLGRPAAVTVKVTATVRGVLAAPALATETVPV